MPGRELLLLLLPKRPDELIAEGIGHLFHVGDFAVVHGKARAHTLPGDSDAAAKFREGDVFVHQVVKNRTKAAPLLRAW